MTDQYRLWFVRRGDQTKGPFPEALVCRHIALGRLGEQDELSLDGVYWRKLDALPELLQAVDALLHAKSVAGEDDVDWHEERAKAALRWLDDRKSPDPRKGSEATATPANRREGTDRRQNPETVESHEYRENRATFESWIRSQRQHYGWAIGLMVACLMAVIATVLWVKPVNPVKVGLSIRSTTCDSPAIKGINWGQCSKEGELLVGADLRSAELVGTNFRNANLRYADLTQANLSQADLTGADLTGTKLGGAVWTDGRVCGVTSVGVCR